MNFRQTPNYEKFEGTQKIGFVLHGTLGAYNGAVEWLCNNNRSPLSSAHYVIGRNEGEVTQLVKNEDVAWHAGIISNPADNAKKVLPKNLLGGFKNPNYYFVGIEFAWGYDVNGDGVVNAFDKTLTDWQIKTAVEIIKSSGIKDPILLSHKEISSYKSDDMLFAVDMLTKILSETKVESKEDIKKQIISLVEKL